MKKDLISVIMAVYNCAPTVQEAIDSIINQTYANWEFIICDDCSTDNTLEIVKEYEEKYPDKFKVIRNDVNSKLSFSLNHCLKYAQGEFIARMDGDDISRSDRFEKQVKYLREHPDIDLVSTLVQRFEGDKLADIIKKPEFPDKYTQRSQVAFNHATIMTYKYVYDKCGGYTVSKRTVRAQDYDLWFRFFYHDFKGINMQEPLYLMREDMSAIKRRTFMVRFHAHRTTIKGFRLLKYPLRWYIKPTLQFIGKSLVPGFIVYKYRQIQARKAKNSTKEST
ncbi:MAG: glycosyltransferase [Ruminococcus sp.]|nr:glycosyltransferase [Oscillospiraceae bacterium]MBR2724969.1 glycosyltransferase [Ruminococcus sp.]